MTDFSKNNPKTGKAWTVPEMQAELTRLQTELAEANNKNTREITMRVSESTGAICLYGINARFPHTFYAEQFNRLFNFFESPVPAKVQAFIEKHKALIAFKDDSPEVQASKLALRQASKDPDVSHKKEQATPAPASK